MTCPFCGAAARTQRRFQCWTLSDITEQSETCMEREIENLKARIARLEEAGSEALRLAALNEWRDASLLWHKAKEEKP